ncbi:3'(2'),5'-bisphosphate nucleotidase CysQ [Buchnera aphidicola]|uniref:3'(2'),5'-bisphosphate nucleotidase CysQ n=1 Tax=Buchnera aphidicola TaxID=9 RepID=UPI0034643CFA
MLKKILVLVKEVGFILMKYYRNEVKMNISYKLDKSPVTEADKIAHNIIKNKLSLLTPNISFLSEENLSDWNKDKNWNKYWLIDPLDGTKEFVNKRDEFTINIALIDQGTPVFGVIYVPFFDILYYTDNNKAWKQEKGYKKEIHVRKFSPPNIALSYYHNNHNIYDALEKLKPYKIFKIGSSLKFCLVAEGKIQLYPRIGKTKIWDTAAGDAIVTAAGGIVRTCNNMPLNYFPSINFCNPGFFAASDQRYKIEFYKNKINN